jgi:hypothetical protein
MSEQDKEPIVKTRRSDFGRKRKNGKTAASALIDTIAALDGLSDEDIRKVLSAASIFLGVANFADGK